jgi:adenylate cyclase
MSGEVQESGLAEQMWQRLLTTGEIEKERRQRRFLQVLPGSPRCKTCYAPFSGPGSLIARGIYGKRQSNMNPQLCNACEEFARTYQGGAEVDLTLLFVDVRDSTGLAERMSATEFRGLINRFYTTATRIMVRSNALIDKIIGDEATGIYVPGFAGPHHPLVGVHAAQDIMKASGHGDPEGPWISLGAGVHTGRAFVGTVGSAEGRTDVTVLGDAANVAARLASSAGRGEILVSESAASASGLSSAGLERRELALKGKTAKVAAFVLTDYAR